ncbi:MAG: class F sortase [Candidatus Parcubacteria bacterium]|nr:class F sortase [Candidatus Parcubacteria bacterium]
MNFPKQVSTLAWLIGGALLVAFSIIVIFLPDTTAIGSAGIAAVTGQATSSLPVRLKIPAIQVDAAVLPIGLDSGGAMDVPKGPVDVAWFDKGPRPGENGSAVIAGHFGWKENIPAVFDDLSSLRKGDKIYVENDTGEITTFVVRESRLFGEQGNAAEVFSSSDGKAHLNLITCEGVWNKETKSYSERLVVFADKE